jgi:hypothetical protein
MSVPFDIALLDNYVGNIDCTKLEISNNFIDSNIINLINYNNSKNLGTLFEPHQKLKKFPKTSRGFGGKKPGDPRFNIKSHLRYIEDLKNNKIPNLDISAYLFKIEVCQEINIIDYINNLKNMYEYDIYSNNNDINYILNKYYYKTN